MYSLVFVLFVSLYLSSLSPSLFFPLSLSLALSFFLVALEWSLDVSWLVACTMRVVRHYCAPLAAGVHSRAMLDNWLLLLLLRPPIRTRLLQKANQGHGCVHVLSAPERATELKLDGTFASCEYVWGVALAEAETCGFCICYRNPPYVLAICKCAIKLEFRCPFRGREHTDAHHASFHSLSSTLQRVQLPHIQTIT